MSTQPNHFAPHFNEIAIENTPVRGASLSYDEMSKSEVVICRLIDLVILFHYLALSFLNSE